MCRFWSQLQNLVLTLSMKWGFVSFCLFWWAQPLLAQYGRETATVNAAVIPIPDSATHSVGAIAGYVKDHCPTEPEKIHTLFKWVTGHIGYDTDSMYHYNWSKSRATVAATTLKRRKGVCENFAALFTELLVQSDIPAWVVTGYTKAAGRVAYSGHSWCAVQRNGTWWLCDPTWAVGNSNYDQWLMAAPDAFVQTHIPFDPMWQLRYYPITHKAFKQGKTRAADNTPYFNYPDSIRLFFQLDTLRQLEAMVRRMYQTRPEDGRLQLWHSYNEMKIAIIYGDRDMELYNSAVDLLNEATAIYNGFVAYRNKQFVPVRNDAAIGSLLQPIDHLLTTAQQHLNQIGRVVENFQYDTGGINERIKALSAKVQVQQTFVNQYLATSPTERKKLFYAKKVAPVGQ